MMVTVRYPVKLLYLTHKKMSTKKETEKHKLLYCARAFKRPKDIAANIIATNHLPYGVQRTVSCPSLSATFIVYHQ
ncbi:hypothetical protein CVS40_5364 [Lucilia cuprina]|nr:hypothetical protein CVS40_5364 [Lucilia cuprina]